MQWSDKYSALDGRKSFSAFTESFAETAGGMEDAHKQYLSMLDGLKNAAAKTGETLTEADKAANEVLGKTQSALTELEQAAVALKARAELGVKGWVAKDAKQAAEVKRLEAAYTRANTTFEKALGSFTEGEHPELTKFRDAFEHLRTQVKSGEGVMNGMFGLARVNGLGGIGETVGHNLRGFKFWEEGYKLSTKNAPALAFRAGALVAAGAALTDSIARSRTNDGEDRSFASRVLEAAGGVGLLSAALLAGRAH